MGQQLDRFLDIVARLRAPDGCPWDREQTHKSLQNCLLDESYEFFDAVELNDDTKMKEELGDLLLQIVLNAQIGSERGAFDIESVAAGISEKLVSRHPHVFGDATVADAGEVLHNWERIKKEEKKHVREYIVDDIPEAMPALFRAEKMQRRVARVGFDWTDARPVLDKVVEEFGEFREAVLAGDAHHAEEELGDIMFALVNVARHQGICSEDALRLTTHKFARRFRYIEEQYKKTGRDIHEGTLEEMDRFWNESKKVVG